MRSEGYCSPVCMYVCVYVCPLIPAASHIGITKERYQRILQAFSNVGSAERKVMISVLKCLYFLCKNEIQHTTNFVPILVKSIRATYVDSLNLGRNAHYTSERFLQEAVSALAGSALGGVIKKYFVNLDRPLSSLSCVTKLPM